MLNISNNEIRKLLSVVDYSHALKIEAGEDLVRTACSIARKYKFRAVVAFPQYVGLMTKELAGSGILVQIPVGFPCGGTTTAVKCFEAEEGLKQGATDMDMVMSIGAFKERDYSRVAEDIKAVLSVARPYKVPFKVIIETGCLSDEEKVTAAKLVADSGANFVKTCTGFGPGRATIHDIALLSRAVGDRIGIKASGGIRFVEDAIALMNAGATVVAMRESLIDQLTAMGYEPSD